MENNLHLEKPEFYQQINNSIEKHKNDSNTLNPIERWIYVKRKVIQDCKDFSKQVASERELIISQLSEKTLQMQSNIATSVNPTQQQIKILQDSKDEISQLLEEKTKGTLFCAKANWAESGEKNSKLFFNLEKLRYNAKVCNKLLDKENKEVTEPKKIRQMQKEFYQNLYQSDKTVTFNLQNENGITLPKELREQHEKPFSLDELKFAVRQMKRNKTPGVSGLTADFYKAFFSKISDILFAAIEQM